MHKEIEKRFLVLSFDNDFVRSKAREGIPVFDIIQAYFVTAPTHSLRVRITNNERAEFTRKFGIGENRDEDPHPIPLETARFVMESCPHQLHKTRHVIDGWEFDFFHGNLNGIFIAEFEKKIPDQEVVLPTWIREAIDVTDSLTNHHLARLAYDLSGGLSSAELREVVLGRKIKKIVLTGGPCSGKSTIMQEIKKKFGDTVHCVPEVASIVIGQVGVLPPATATVREVREFQRSVSHVQRLFEQVSMLQAVREGKKAVIVDRGVIDNAAYVAGGMDELCNVLGTDPNYEYSQYDHVVYLDMPPEDVYLKRCADNPNRYETFDQAVVRSQKTIQAWCRHPHFFTVIGRMTWEKKVERTLSQISGFLAR